MKHTYSKQLGELKLVPMTLEDSEKYRQLRNMRKNRGLFYHSDLISKSDQIKWFNESLNNETEVMFSILNSDDEFIGANSFYNIDWTCKTAEYGRLLVKPQFRGRHFGEIATETALLIGSDMGLKIVNLSVFASNTVAIKVYKKVGFSAIGSHYDSSKNLILDMSYEY